MKGEKKMRRLRLFLLGGGTGEKEGSGRENQRELSVKQSSVTLRLSNDRGEKHLRRWGDVVQQSKRPNGRCLVVVGVRREW